MKKPSQSVIIALIVVVALIVIVAAQMFFTLHVSQSGIVATVGIETYSDALLTQKCTNISWGTVGPGSATARMLYIKNNGTVPVTLAFNVTDWNPVAAAQYIGLSWNYTNLTIQPNAAVATVLTLTVLANITGVTTFSNNLLITATG